MNYKDLNKELLQLLEEKDQEKEELLQEMKQEKSVFETLNAVNVNGHTEEKGGLTYLSWAWAWSEFKKHFPNATYEVYKNENGLPFVYDENTGYMVYTSVTVDDLKHEMWLPVMDGTNKAMLSKEYSYTVRNPYFKYAKLDEKSGKYLDRYGNEQKETITKTVQKATMFDINKTVMRCLTKNLAMFGLGLYIYAGEDLPEVDDTPKQAGAEVITELTNLRQEIESLGVDTRDLKFVNYVCEKAKVQSLDSAYLLTNEQGAFNVVEVYKGVIENKKKKQKQEKVVEVVEPTLDDLLDSAEMLVGEE